VTYDQVAARQQKAIRFLRDVLQDDEEADDFESMSVPEYAEHKRLVI
jgi:hypothetical protein